MKEIMPHNYGVHSRTRFLIDLTTEEVARVSGVGGLGVDVPRLGQTEPRMAIREERLEFAAG